MLIPIYIDGRQQGQLTVERQGAATVMRADLNDVGRVVRLKVFGERTGYLGVPVPEEGRLRLTKRLSPAEMACFPQRPEYAAEKPMDREKPAPQLEKTRPAGPEDPPEGRHIVWMGGKPHFF